VEKHCVTISRTLIVIVSVFSTRGTAFISGHADGSIVRYTITEGSTTEQQVSNIGTILNIIRNKK
jgi:hypothetical protein